MLLLTRPQTSLPPLLRAAGKAVASRVRALGLLAEAPDWSARAEICERCPLRVTQGCTSYCGRPFLQLPDRDPVRDGCGCPTRAKAKDPKEHCPITLRHVAATREGAACDCKWCVNRAGQP
ncbi:MAG: hypothetical protein ACTHLZ_05955 [Tepidisphaeraceae bacterium]